MVESLHQGLDTAIVKKNESMKLKPILERSGTPEPTSPNPMKVKKVSNGGIGYEKTLYYLPMRGYKACWPYVTYSGFKGYLWIFNAYDQKQLIRIAPPIGSNLDKNDKLRII